MNTKDYDETYENIDPDRAMGSTRFVGCFWIIILIVGIVLCMCSGCTTTKYVEVPGPAHTDTVRQVIVQHDSLVMKDSVHVTEKGDTVMIDRWHTRYVMRQTHDTLYKATHDTIPAPYPVIKEVEKNLTLWQQARLCIANITLWAVLIMAVLWLIKKKFS